MMGSRGDPSPQVSALAHLTATLSPSQASTVAAVCELFAMLQHSEPILAAAIKDFRAAEETARDAQAKLAKTVAQHTARLAEFATRSSELDQLAIAVAAREAACQEREANTDRKLAAFDETAAALTARAHELDRLTKVLDGDRAALDVNRLQQIADQEAAAKALADDVDRHRRASEAEIKEIRDKAASDIRDRRAEAQSEIAALRTEIGGRETAVAAREKAFEIERARFSALLEKA